MPKISSELRFVFSLRIDAWPCMRMYYALFVRVFLFRDVFSWDNLTKFGASVILYILLLSLYLTGLGFHPFFLIPSSLQAACVYMALFFVPLFPVHLPLLSLPSSFFSSSLCGSPSSVSSEATSSSVASDTSLRTSHSSSSFFSWPFVHYINPWSATWSSSIVGTVHTSNIYRLLTHHSPSRLLCQYPDILIFPLLSASFLIALRLFTSLASSLAAWLTVGERCPTARGGGGEIFCRGDEEETAEEDDDDDDEDDLRHRKAKESSLVQSGRPFSSVICSPVNSLYIHSIFQGV